jgi:hypothetical protein
MDRKLFFISLAVAAAIGMTACSSAPPPTAKEAADAKKQEEAKPPEPVPARAVYFEMYKQARSWAPDLLALTVKSGELPDVKNVGGKAALWTVVFVSPSRKEARTFTHAVANKGLEIREGINVSDKQTWAGATQASKVFTNGEFLVDSDVAYKAAAEKAAPWLKAHANAPVSLTLGSGARFPGPVWYILFGTAKEGYAVYVDAVTGAVLNK